MKTLFDDPLAQAFVKETLCQARCELYYQKAKLEGNRQAATMFQALSRASQVHAHKALMLLRGKVSNTQENKETLLGEIDEILTLYKDNLHQTEGAVHGFLDQFQKTMTIQKMLLQRQHEDVPVTYHVCTVCGFIAQENIPERCPVCDAVQTKFVSY